MKNLCLFLFVTFFLTSISADEVNHDDPAFRKAIINNAYSLLGKGEYAEAAKYYRFGIMNWNKPEQMQDLEAACQALFALLYGTNQHDKNRGIFDNCPKELTEAWYGTEDRDYYPVLKVAPRYPKKALDDRLEGWVIVEFDIDKRGRVKNVEAVESSDSLFNTSAIKAAKSFLYLPKIENGAPAEVQSVRNKITFALDAPS
ncbi:MAG TPA: energy transducer TonB [Gammaproteobacteria bacterium]